MHSHLARSQRRQRALLRLPAQVATVLALGAYLLAPTQAWLQPARSSPAGASQDDGLRRRQLLLLLPGAASFIGADKALGQTTAPSGGAAAAPDLSALFDPSLFGDYLAQAMNGTAVGPDGTPAPGNSGLLAVALGAGIFLAILVPIFKFIIAGASTLFFIQVADERFNQDKSRRQGQGGLEKFLRRLNGEQEDAIDARSLEVRRLNDELVGLQANLVEQADGQGSAESIRERRKAKRFAANWDATISSLGITEDERTEVEDAVRTFREEVEATEEELALVRQRWRKVLLSKGDVTAPVSSYVRRVEALNKHEKIYKGEEKLLKELRETLPEDKYDALRKSLSEKEDLTWLLGGSSQGSAAPKRAYVLSFDGDLGASRAKELSREISVILSAPGPQPEEVVLLLRSPGGSVTGYGLAAAELLRLRQRDPPVKLTVCVDELAASGGYLMACCADRILCSPFAAVGSIGVIAQIPNAAKRLEREGLEFIETTAGKWKRTVTPFKVPSAEDLAKQKEDISAVYRQFSTFVHRFRPHVDIEKVATGEVWYGEDAMKRDLVDELKTSAQYLLELMQEGVEVYSVSFKANTSQQGLLAAGATSGLLKELLQRELGSGSTPGGGMLDRLRELTGGLVPGDFSGQRDGRPMLLAEEERLAPQLLAAGLQETDASLDEVRLAMRRLQPEIKQRLLEELLASERARL